MLPMRTMAAAKSFLNCAALELGRVALDQRVGGAAAEELLVGVQHPALR